MKAPGKKRTGGWMNLIRILALAFAFPTSLTNPVPTIGGCPVFPADNVWNTRIDSLPVDVHSASFINNITASGTLRYDVTIPVNIVPGTQPNVPITINYPDESDPGPMPIPPNA